VCSIFAWRWRFRSPFSVLYSSSFVPVSSAQLSPAQLSSVRSASVFRLVLSISFRPLAAPAYPRLSQRIFLLFSQHSYSYTAFILRYPILFYPTSDQHTRLESLASMPSRSVFFFCM
jgi:hypothetical protein